MLDQANLPTSRDSTRVLSRYSILFVHVFSLPYSTVLVRRLPGVPGTTLHWLLVAAETTSKFTFGTRLPVPV